MGEWGIGLVFLMTVLVIPIVGTIDILLLRRRRKRAKADLHASAPDIERTIDKIMRLPKAERDALARTVDELLAERGRM